MHINSINNTTAYNNTFKGLWGKTSSDTDIDNVLCIPSVTTTYYYYPYKNEDPNRIKVLENSIESAEIKNDENGDPKCFIEDCKVCARLPFDANEYLEYRNYTKSSPLTNLLRAINSIARDKYISREYGPEQISAFNPAVDEKIEEEEEAKRLY